MSMSPPLMRAFHMPHFLGVMVLMWVGFAGFASHAFGQAPTFSGRYDGIGIGSDAVLSLEELEGRVVGRLTLKDNKSFSLNGRRSGDMAQGSLVRNAVKQFFHIEHRALGVQLLIIPAGDDGVPLLKQGQELSFIRQGVQLPKPVSFKMAPAAQSVALPNFLNEFRNWSPQDLARIYVGLNAKDQGLISLFDYASAEILWRICVSSPPHKTLSTEQLAQLLARQATDCSAYLKMIAKVRDSGQIDLFIRRANFQFELIRKTYECDHQQKSQSNCHEVNALSAPLISEWRPAVAIMAALVKPQDVKGKVAYTPLSKPPVASQKATGVNEGVVAEKENTASALRSTIEAFAPVPQVRPSRSIVEPSPSPSTTPPDGPSVRVPLQRPHY
ncbi:MAG: hypothetical protein KUG59_01725 [Parvibaculaceae bacterium]|nr:hypothetical protein [Parvibaculaceae bacterium]